MTEITRHESTPPVENYPPGIDNVIPTYRRTSPPLPYPGTPASPVQVQSVLTNYLATVTSLEPASAKIGGENFVLRVHGTNFRGASKVLWDGETLPTSFVNASELVAGVDLSSGNFLPRDVAVQVKQPRGYITNVVAFTLEAPDAADTRGHH